MRAGAGGDRLHHLAACGVDDRDGVIRRGLGALVGDIDESAVRGRGHLDRLRSDIDPAQDVTGRGVDHLPDRIGQVKAWSDAAKHAGADPTVWISCGSGFRAMVGGSLLARAGVPVVVGDDEFTAAASTGVSIIRDEHAAMLGEAYTD